MASSESCELDTEASWLPSVRTSFVQQQRQFLYNRPQVSEIPVESAIVATKQDIDRLYYAKCLVGGALSSSIRWALTPMDFIKTSMQADPNRYSSFAEGLSLVYRQQGVSGLYRGFTPTVLAYSTQSGTKYMAYEYHKHHISQKLGPEFTSEYKSIIYLVSAASAEAIADVLMCPWEMLKVKVQISKFGEFPSRFQPALVAMIRERHHLGFPFGSLKPLWSRQVVCTVANFMTFEHTVNAIYKHILDTHHKNEYSSTTQLAVTFVAGYVSGIVATVVSHPADSLLSLQVKYPDKSFQEILRIVGWRKLVTEGLMPRVVMTGTIIASQWLLYDSFKSLMGLGTSGCAH